jgi:hypothetical protein
LKFDIPARTEQRYEVAAFHSITSSARASSVGGTSRPSGLAVAKVEDQLDFGGTAGSADRRASRP